MEDFSIDWSNPMAMFTNGGAPQMNGEEMQEENGHDFYDEHNDNSNSSSRLDGQTAAGAVQHKPQTATAATTSIPIVQQTDSAKRLENQRRAEILRAKLLASRQNTPAKAATPAKTAPPVDTPTKAPAKATPPPTQPPQQNGDMHIKRQESAAELDVEALLTASKAQADAEIAAAKEREVPASSPVYKSAPVVTNGMQRRHAKDKDLITGEPVRRHEQQSTESTPPAKLSTNLADSYYTDLAAWLELTGYHDIDYRNSKLRTYKERRALEEEAARIAEKLEKLRQAEQAEMHQMRMSTPAVKMPDMAPPPLPQSIDPLPQLNGTKRGRSPETTSVEKRQREDNGFRIRGVKESPDGRPMSYRRGRSPSPGYDRRMPYSDTHRRSSVDERVPPGGRSRDPSLERRAQYYRRDEDFPHYDHYTPREAVSRERYPLTNGPRSGRPGGREIAPNYRPSAGLELKKGGVRYFMIKSWNMENVHEAQRTNIWATQEKNEEMLTHAVKTVRHVILLFSVNKSMAFQGYALMTSAPDSKIQKPSFTSKLNRATSPAFTLRWLAKTPIHFKLVGHIKNTLNYDEEKGEPHAVLVGKDGQEIDADAGMGVVWVLDDAEMESRSGGGKR
ncbi:Putative YTH domain containing protein [Septoria linicola]|uniref:YTH domain containing protein n=1 Tax=Septoria linicola TaxID=215465 RepID=A0A9Q9AVT9_9PEZI|nr:Putative YTH domain containing protein [Septoria linicola]